MAGKLRIQSFVDPIFGENAYVLLVEGQRQCWIVDPGLQAEQLCGWVCERDLQPSLVINTHCHADHIAGNEIVKRAFPEATLCVPAAEADMLLDPVENLSQPFGMSLISPPADRTLQPGDELFLESLPWHVLDLSGHSPGGIGLYCPQEAVVLVGDAVFAGSIGRTDFPHSDHRRLIENIHRHLLSLPDKTRLLPGHGDPTTVGEEKGTNPFLSVPGP